MSDFQIKFVTSTFLTSVPFFALSLVGYLTSSYFLTWMPLMFGMIIIFVALLLLAELTETMQHYPQMKRRDDLSYLHLLDSWYEGDRQVPVTVSVPCKTSLKGDDLVRDMEQKFATFFPGYHPSNVEIVKVETPKYGNHLVYYDEYCTKIKMTISATEV